MSIILAKIFGIYFLALGIAFIINPKSLKDIYPKVMNDEGFLMLGGIFAILIGATVISIHNLWTLHWPVIITILGWWSLIKGFALLADPRFVTLFSFVQNRSETFYRTLSCFYLVLGLLLLILSFRG